MVEQLAMWWAKKYKTPWNHELFQERTLLDLLVEYWLDVYEDKPLEAHRNEDGFIQLQDTGDTLIDKWEEVIARGEEPDLSEAFSPEAWEKLHRMRDRAKKMDLSTRGMTMKDTMDRVDRDVRLQQRKDPTGNKLGGLNTFGDGFD